MAKVNLYISNDAYEKINAIIEKRRQEGAREKDVSFSATASMLLELGLRVYEAQMERKESAFLRELYAVANREPVTIHPDDAQARGITEGDMVRVWNSRGQILAGAVISEGIKPGVICIHEGAWPDLDLTADGICKNGAVNVLTKDLPSSRLGNGCAGNTALAWLEKYNGPELTLTAFEPPASS